MSGFQPRSVMIMALTFCLACIHGGHEDSQGGSLILLDEQQFYILFFVIAITECKGKGEINNGTQ